jgi:hypothetical protein
MVLLRYITIWTTRLIRSLKTRCWPSSLNSDEIRPCSQFGRDRGRASNQVSHQAIGGDTLLYNADDSADWLDSVKDPDHWRGIRFKGLKMLDQLPGLEDETVEYEGETYTLREVLSRLLKVSADSQIARHCETMERLFKRLVLSRLRIRGDAHCWTARPPCGATGGILLTHTCTPLYHNECSPERKEADFEPSASAYRRAHLHHCKGVPPVLHGFMRKGAWKCMALIEAFSWLQVVAAVAKYEENIAVSRHFVFFHFRVIQLSTCSSSGGNCRPAIASGADAVTPWHVAFSERWYFRYYSHLMSLSFRHSLIGPLQCTASEGIRQSPGFNKARCWL